MNFCHLQSKCFFLGPIISSVVALHTDLASPCPAKLWRAANNLSFIVCPAIFFLLNLCCCWSSFYCWFDFAILYTNTHIHSLTMGRSKWAIKRATVTRLFRLSLTGGEATPDRMDNYGPTIQHLLHKMKFSMQWKRWQLTIERCKHNMPLTQTRKATTSIRSQRTHRQITHAYKSNIIKVIDWLKRKQCREGSWEN